MSALKPIFLVQSSVIAGGMLGDVVGLECRPNIAQCPSHDLFDLSRVEVDARPETCHEDDNKYGSTVVGDGRRNKPVAENFDPLCTIICLVSSDSKLPNRNVGKANDKRVGEG